MEIIIDYFLFVVNRLITILDGISFNGSASLLYYLLGAIIIGFIIKLIKGGSAEFEQNTNFLSSRIVVSGVSKYQQVHKERKKQIIEQQKIKQSESVSKFLDSKFDFDVPNNNIDL